MVVLPEQTETLPALVRFVNRTVQNWVWYGKRACLAAKRRPWHINAVVYTVYCGQSIMVNVYSRL